DARVAGEHVDFAECFDGATHEFLPRVARGDVAFHRDGAPPERLDFADDFVDGRAASIRCVVIAPVVDRHVRAFGGAGYGYRAADTARAACDDYDLVLEQHVILLAGSSIRRAVAAPVRA